MKTTLLALFLTLVCTLSKAQEEPFFQNFEIKSTNNHLYKAGTIVGSIKVKGKIYDQYQVSFKLKGTKGNQNRVTFSIYAQEGKGLFGKALKPDFWDSSGAAKYIFTRKRSEGEYEFDRASYNSVMPYPPFKSEGKRIPLHHNFKVNEKEIYYVGEIEIDTEKGTVLIQDKAEIDLPLIKQRYSTTRWDMYKNAELLE